MSLFITSVLLLIWTLWQIRRLEVKPRSKVNLILLLCLWMHRLKYFNFFSNVCYVKKMHWLDFPGQRFFTFFSISSFYSERANDTIFQRKSSQGCFFFVALTVHRKFQRPKGGATSHNKKMFLFHPSDALPSFQSSPAGTWMFEEMPSITGSKLSKLSSGWFRLRQVNIPSHYVCTSRT